MRFFVRLTFLALFIAAFMLTACGEDGFDPEKPLSKIFIMDDGSGGDAKTTLDEKTIQDLNLNKDDEKQVVQNLTNLLDKSFDIEKEEERARILNAMEYGLTILERSDLLPKEFQSPCDCEYKLETFKLALDVVGQYAVQIHTQNIDIRKREEPKTYNGLYQALTVSKKYLNAIATLDVAKKIQDKSDEEPLTKIQNAAKSYLEKLFKKEDSKKEAPPKNE